MKKLMFVLLLGMFSQAQGATVTATEGIGSFTQWGILWDVEYNSFFGGNGMIEYDDGTGTPIEQDTVTITGSTVATGGFPLFTQMTTNSATGAGAVSFDFLINPGDNIIDDVFVFIDNLILGTVLDVQVQTLFRGGCITPCLSGNAIFMVDALALWGFSVDAFGGGSIGTEVEISNLQYPGQQTVIPLPPAFLLFGAALVGLGFVKKRREATG